MQSSSIALIYFKSRTDTPNSEGWGWRPQKVEDEDGDPKRWRMETPNGGGWMPQMVEDEDGDPKQWRMRMETPNSGGWPQMVQDEDGDPK